MKTFIISLLLTASVCGCAVCAGCAKHDDSQTAFAEQALDYCVDQTRRSLEALQPFDCMMSPRNIAPGAANWSLLPVSREQWTEGFWPGILWYAAEYSGDAAIRSAAEAYTAPLEMVTEGAAYDHDIGFIVFCSFGNGYRLTGNSHYREVLMRAADSLCELFNPRVGTILSWPREVGALGGHNTIMDNLMNLELLFWASEQSGNPRYAEIARSHADTTMRYNFRPDGTSYHVAVYDPSSGQHIRSCTHQGYADDSMWARGQAWGVYGYTMCYRFTHDRRYLDFARRITDVWLEGLPEDGIPYWDYNDPRIPDAPRDASAAAIVASALVELSDYAEGEDEERYLAVAERILHSLDSNYRGADDCTAFLLHSTGHHPAGSEIDYSIIYADYYYIEALMRLDAKLKRK